MGTLLTPEPTGATKVASVVATSVAIINGVASVAICGSSKSTVTNIADETIDMASYFTNVSPGLQFVGNTSDIVVNLYEGITNYGKGNEFIK